MKIKNSQKGFTLIEILVAVAVDGLLLSGLVVSIFQTFGVTRQSTTQITALENVKNVAYRVSKDVKMANTTNLGDGTVIPPLVMSNLTLDWVSWLDSGGNLVETYYRTKYTLSGGKIQRQYGSYVPPRLSTDTGYDVYISVRASWISNPLLVPDSNFTWQPTRTVGQYISAIQFSRQGNIIFMTITSSPDGRLETARTYRLYLQPKEAPLR